jgi:pyruvate/2-oxoglutarate dehydrogenase complex dihydrolipoamide acyltransferase (E2) component
MLLQEGSHYPDFPDTETILASMSSPAVFSTRKWRAKRNIIVDTGHIASKRHIIHGLVEIDVTGIRDYIRNQKESSEGSLSFTGYIAKCLADTIASSEDHAMAHAYRNFWGNQLIIPEHVHVVTLIETKRNGVALPHVIREADMKSWQEISDEIRSVQNEPRMSKQNGRVNKMAGSLPAWIRRLTFRILTSRPKWIIETMGTTAVSSIGMFGDGAGWGIGYLPFHTMGIFVGGIERKPVFVDGGDKIEAREFVSITLSFDHDIVHGAPAARFTNTFQQMMAKSCPRKEE